MTSQVTQRPQTRRHNAAGFSLLELVIGMTLLLIAMVAASTLLTTSLRTRTRENQKSDALADAQRAVNIMSREIGNSGFGLMINGLVAADCHTYNPPSDTRPTSIRLRANLNNTNATTSDTDEDITFIHQPANNAILRYDRNANSTTVLANGVTTFRVFFLDAAGNTAASIDAAVRVRLNVIVQVPSANGLNSADVQLTSDIALRNAPSLVKTY